MAVLSQDVTDQLDDIKAKVKDWHDYFGNNIKLYHKCKKLVFKTSITQEDQAVLDALEKPSVEFNVLEAYINRLRGEFSKQAPSITVMPKNEEGADEQLIEVLQGHYKSILDEANSDQMENEAYKDTLGGGFSAVKVWTEYESDNSFNQVIRIGRVYDPTMCGWDPTANLNHKGDGRHCFEMFPMSKEECEATFDISLDDIDFSRSMSGPNWFYENPKRKIALVCRFYKKVIKKVRICLLADGSVMTQKEYKNMIDNWHDFAAPPAISKARWANKTHIDCFTVIGDRVLDHYESDYEYLPIVFMDGNSVMIRETETSPNVQLIRPYVYHAIDAQRMKNFVGQTFLNEIENIMQHKMMLPIDALPHKTEQSDPWFNHQKAATLLYNDKDPQGGQLPPPQAVPRVAIPPEIYASFNGSDSTIQSILGSYDAALGINNNQLSGVAIVEGATQSNATAMPYIINFMAALTQAGKIVLDLIPKYYVTPRTIPVTDSEGKRAYKKVNQQQPNSVQLNYDTSSLDIMVKASANFEVQKMRALDAMTKLMQVMPSFNQMMNQKGLPIILDNLDIRGAEQLKELANEFMQEQKQQAQQQGSQPNPEVMKTQLQAQKQQADTQLAQAQLRSDQQKSSLEAQLKAMGLKLDQEQLQMERMRLILEQEQAQNEAKVQAFKAAAEIQRSNADIHLAQSQHAHKVRMDVINHHFQSTKKIQQPNSEMNS